VAQNESAATRVAARAVDIRFIVMRGMQSVPAQAAGVPAVAGSGTRRPIAAATARSSRMSIVN